MRYTVCLVGLLLLALIVPASSSAGIKDSGSYCYSVLIGSGSTCVHGTWHTRHSYIWGETVPGGSAKSGAWLVNSRRERISRAVYCEQPGCRATVYWGCQDGPPGFASVHNHSGFQSRFQGYLAYCY